MRLQLLIVLGNLLLAPLAYGQSESTFSIDVSTSTVRLGEPFDVTLRLENGGDGQVVTPDWEAAGFSVIHSSQSSSFTFSNGKANTTAVFQYKLVARDTGMLEIPSAIVRKGANELRTTPQALHVLPGDGHYTPPKPPGKKEPAAPAKNPKKKIKTIQL